MEALIQKQDQFNFFVIVNKKVIRMKQLKVIFVFFLIITIISGCSGNTINTSPDIPSPTDTIKSYETAFNNADVNTINEITTEKFRTKLSREVDLSDSEGIKKIFDEAGINKVEYVIEKENKVSDNSVKITLNTKFHTASGEIIEEKDAFILIKVDNKWLIDEITSPDEFTPAMCSMRYFSCSDWSIKDGKILLKIGGPSGVGGEASDFNLKIIDEETGVPCKGEISMPKITTGTKDFEIDCSNIVTGKQSFRGNIQVTFNTPDRLIEDKDGKLYSRVE